MVGVFLGFGSPRGPPATKTQSGVLPSPLFTALSADFQRVSSILGYLLNGVAAARVEFEFVLFRKRISRGVF